MMCILCVESISVLNHFDMYLFEILVDLFMFRYIYIYHRFIINVLIKDDSCCFFIVFVENPKVLIVTYEFSRSPRANTKALFFTTKSSPDCNKWIYPLFGVLRKR